MEYNVDRFMRIVTLLVVLMPLITKANIVEINEDNESRFERITTQAGLNTNRISKLFRDHQGYLWMIGVDVVARYDGYNLYNLPIQERTNKKGNVFKYNSIIQDDYHNIWIGGTNGITVIDTIDQITNFQLDTNTEISTLFPYDQERIWASSKSGDNFIIDVHSHETKKLHEKDVVRSFVIDPKGQRWIATKHGEILKEFHKRILQIESEINDICFTPSGKMYIATNDGLLSVESELLNHNDERRDREGMFLDFVSGSGEKVITVEYHDGSVWTGTKWGVREYLLDSAGNISYKREYNRHPNVTYSLPNNQINDLLSDHQGIMWIATNGGVAKIDPEKLWFYSIEKDPSADNTLHSNAIFPVSGDLDGNIWMGSYSSGISRYNVDANKFTWFNAKNSNLKRNHILFIDCDANGSTWAVTPNKIFSFEDNSWSEVILKSEINYRRGDIIEWIENNDSTFWAACRNQLLLVQRKGKQELTVLKKAQVETAKKIICLFKDKRGRIWLGTRDGVYCVSETGELLVKYFESGEFDKGTENIQAINSDAKGNIWLGSSQGIFVIKNDSILEDNTSKAIIKRFNKNDGLPSNYVTGLMPGDNDAMYIAT
ncbi:hypothetical protein EYV94_13215 [Puteibacter caeruleilacunae]|nr:hypothetical protein EYV94_13215 [Puteibacter caeruleilacunae]